MSEPLQEEEEVLDGLPVLPEESAGGAEAAGVDRAGASSSRALTLSVASPAQAAAVAVGGFVAGAAVVGLVRHRHAKRALAAGRGGATGLLAARAGRRLAARRSEGKGPVGELVQIVASRSLLVDVHLLGSSGTQR